MTIRILTATLLAVFFLSACADSSSLVVNPNNSEYKATTVKLQYEGATVNVEDESVEELKKYMDEEFFGDEGAFTAGEDMIVKYGFVGFDEGSQAARYFLGPIGGGEARMVVRAEFLDPEGNSLAVIQSEGRLSAGIFGGDAGSAIRGAAKEIAQYAQDNFTDKPEEK